MRETARLMIMDGLSAREVSEKLGVNQDLLYRWRKKYLAQDNPSVPMASDLSPTQLALELGRVRKELAREKRINAILKKTVGYFAKEQG